MQRTPEDEADDDDDDNVGLDEWMTVGNTRQPTMHLILHFHHRINR